VQLLQAHPLPGNLPGVPHQSTADSLTAEGRPGLQTADGAPMSDQWVGATVQVNPPGQVIARQRGEEPAAAGVEAGDDLVSRRRDSGGIDGQKREPDCPSGIADRDPAVNQFLPQSRTDLCRVAELTHHRDNTFTHTDQPDRPLRQPSGGAGALVRLAVMSPEDLPIAEFGFPGPLRDQLVAAIRNGSKTTTSGLVADYEHEGEPLPWPGLRQAVVDSAGNRVAVIETTAVRVIRLGDIDLAHALGEGEAYSSVADWRAGHERFWHSAEMRDALGDPGFTVNDDTLVVAQAFRLVEH
jgi:uncharacterized protein YhfF